MRIKNATYEIAVPAGKYWLGDPCYAVPSDLWMDLLNSCQIFESPIGTIKGEKVYEVLAFGTAHGDGCYEDQHGNSFPVDAGLIGLTPVDLAEDQPFGCTLVHFPTETICSSYGGVLTFGEHEIDTR